MHVVIPKSPKRSPSNFIKVVFTLEAIQTVSKQAGKRKEERKAF